MNPLSDHLVTGVVGELLVQLRLLQYSVQAAPPVADSGNDLIAVRGGAFRAVQVKTTRQDAPQWKVPDPNKAYHILALVALDGEGTELHLDGSDVFFIPREALPESGLPDLEDFRLSATLVEALFDEGN